MTLRHSPENLPPCPRSSKRRRSLHHCPQTRVRQVGTYVEQIVDRSVVNLCNFLNGTFNYWWYTTRLLLPENCAVPQSDRLLFQCFHLEPSQWFDERSFEPDPSSKWPDERVQMERADSTLLKADQPVQFFSDLLSFRNSLQNCFLRFFCRWKEGGLHLAWGRPGSAMTIQLCNCNAIGQPSPIAACNTTKLQNTLK